MKIAFIKNNLALIVLLVLSFLTKFLFISYPAEVVFDEVHYGKYISAYFSNQYYFDNHPPFAKILIFVIGKILGFKPNYDFNSIGDVIPAQDLFALRFLPALFGAVFPLLIYLILRKINISKRVALLGTFLAVFSNALITQSKFIFMDIFLLFFGFLAIYLFLKYKELERKNEIKSFLFLIISLVFAAFAFSVKWTGLLFIGIIGLAVLFDFFRKFKIKTGFLKLLFVIFIPFLTYYLIIMLHLAILYKSGNGDIFMSRAFQKTLEGNNVSDEILSLSNWQKFLELNKKIYDSQVTTTNFHSYSSKWYEWPFGIKPIWYWTKATNHKFANIYFFGNPIIWWTILLGIIFSLYSLIYRETRKKLPNVFWLFLIGYFAGLFPYILITRATFLYHYLPSLIFGILIISILYDKTIQPFLFEKAPKIINTVLYWGFLFLVLLVFLIFSPLNYGFPVSEKMNLFYNIFIKFFS